MEKLLIGFILLCVACQGKYTESFYELHKQAHIENKHLWLNLNYGPDAGIKDTLFQYINKNKPAKQNYLFRQLNILDTTNIFLFYSLLVENSNNGYIFNSQGEIISCTYRPITSKSIHQQLESIKQGQPELPTQTREFSSSSDTLIKMLNQVIKTHLILQNHSNNTDSLHIALNLIEESINIEPYFYNLYLRCKIAEILNMEDAKEYARLAILYCKEGFQTTVYNPMIQELTSKYNISNHCGKGVIKFKESILDAGKIPLNSKHEFQFEFKNTGHEPVIIIYVSSTCGCATPIWNKTPILPNKTGTIKVIFNADKYGNFIRSIFVQSTAQNNIEHLYLRGTVSINLPPMQ